MGSGNRNLFTPRARYPGNDTTKPPTPTCVWRGTGPVGSDMGAWYDTETKLSWRPDLDHAPPIGPHWDLSMKVMVGGKIKKKRWRVFEDGRIERK